MNVLIIEDEQLSASRLKRILSEVNPAAEVLAVLETVQEAVQWLKTNPSPDVALMDVRLADGLSFEVFEKVRVTCPVIFTTAFDEYALRAFKVNGLDYLLKPVEKQELSMALGKVSDRHPESFFQEQMRSFLSQFRGKSTVYRKRFLIPLVDGYKTVPVEEVDYVFSEAKVCHLVLKGGQRIAVPQTMEELEEELDPDAFFRANRQFIVSVESIGSIHNGFNGKLILSLRKDKEVVVSREKAPALKSWLDR